MNFWKKFGWGALGFTPFAAAFIWQIIASFVGIFVYSFYLGIKDAMSGNHTMYVSQEDMLEGFMSGTPYAILMVSVYLGYILIFALWYFFMFCRKKQTGDWKQLLKPQRIGGIIGMGIALQFAISMLLTIVLNMLPDLKESYMEVMNALGNESILMVICVSILAPIGEELIFRGVTLKLFKKAMPWQVAIILQGILFGAYHMNLVQGIYAAVLGFILGYIAHRYGSVIPGILLHMAINSFSYALGYILPESLEEQTGVMIVIAVVAIAATVGFLFLTLKGVKPTEVITKAASEVELPNTATN
ncbi:MAG: CPBP family intramembrane metalloprotease [Lachnospiraceae bacterium]|nr:CPBP family intramembrane metalloprotease [Lachnospiraceae bacterium]